MCCFFPFSTQSIPAVFDEGAPHEVNVTEFANVIFNQRASTHAHTATLMHTHIQSEQRRKDEIATLERQLREVNNVGKRCVKEFMT